jgi:hypothetical protein
VKTSVPAKKDMVNGSEAAQQKAHKETTVNKGSTT